MTPTVAFGGGPVISLETYTELFILKQRNYDCKIMTLLRFCDS